MYQLVLVKIKFENSDASSEQDAGANLVFD